MSENEQAETEIRFAIFRASESVDFEESGVMSAPAAGSFDVDAVTKLMQAGIDNGANNELLFSGGGMSLAKVWFKSGYPLPRHSHDCACLYYITAGSLRLGKEDLGPGDGFFVGMDVPYTYIAGPDGVELLEFRAATEFGIALLGANAKWGAKALEQLQSRTDAWKSERRPSER